MWTLSTDAHAHTGLLTKIDATVATRTERGSPQRRPAPSRARAAACSPTTIAVRCHHIFTSVFMKRFSHISRIPTVPAHVCIYLPLTILILLAGNRPCRNGGVCTDGIGSYTCACPAGFCGLTCVDQAQNGANGPQCPCVDDPVWVSSQNGKTCADFVGHVSDWCSSSWAADAVGFTAGEACPVACQSGCLLTYDDCCELLLSSLIRLLISS